MGQLVPTPSNVRTTFTKEEEEQEEQGEEEAEEEEVKAEEEDGKVEEEHMEQEEQKKHLRILDPSPLESVQNSNYTVYRYSSARIAQLRTQARGKRKHIMRFEIRDFFLEIGLG